MKLKSDMISVVLPTIKGREEMFEQTVQAYMDNTSCELEIVDVHDKSCVGEAWNEGVQHTNGNYLHLGADDLQPVKGWDIAAVEASKQSIYPAPIVYNYKIGEVDTKTMNTGKLTYGSPASMSTVPFMRMGLWEHIGPVLNIHYYSDDYLSEKARRAGLSVKRVPEYSFVHQIAPEGRGAGMSMRQRIRYDYKLYVEGLNRLTGKRS